MSLSWIRGHLPGFGSSDERIHECRHCGQPLESTVDSCPICGRSGIATYEVG